MQPEETVQIDHRLARNVDAGAHGVILRLAIGNHNVQAIGSTALKDDDQALSACSVFGRAESCPGEETRDRRRADHGESTVAEKYATGDGHGFTPALSYQRSVVSFSELAGS